MMLREEILKRVMAKAGLMKDNGIGYMNQKCTHIGDTTKRDGNL